MLTSRLPVWLPVDVSAADDGLIASVHAAWLEGSRAQQRLNRETNRPGDGHVQQPVSEKSARTVKRPVAGMITGHTPGTTDAEKGCQPL